MPDSRRRGNHVQRVREQRRTQRGEARGGQMRRQTRLPRRRRRPRHHSDGACAFRAPRQCHGPLSRTLCAVTVRLTLARD